MRTKRFLSLTLTLAMLITACFTGVLGVSAATVTATDSHSVYTDDFSDPETLSNWRHSAVGNASYENLTATIADGAMTLGNVNGSGSFLHGMRFIPDKKYTEQRVSVTFKGQYGLKPCLWARVNQQWKGNSQSCYGYYLLFNCNQNGNVTLDLAVRKGTATTTIGSVSYGGTTIVPGQEYRMEMVCQGTNPTLISVNLYTKVGSVENAVAIHDTFIDSEPTVQVPGSAGIAGARTSAVAATDVSVEKFEFTSTDNVSGNYYVDETTTSAKTFGQVVTLDPTKTYVLAADAVYKDLRNGEDVNALWIEYFNTSSKGTRLLTARSSLKSNRSEADAEAAGIDYDEYFRVFYEFDMSTLIDNKVEEGMNNKTRVIVGTRNDGNIANTSGKFSNFTLYAKDDPNKTNLLVNPDFKMGFYGWSDEAGSYMNYAQMEESVGTATKGNVTLSSAINDYQYYDIFKNGVYTVTEGDATRDGIVDLKDLVRTKKISSGLNNYFVAVDYDANGAVAATDITFLRKQILDISFEASEQVNVAASDVLASTTAATNVALGGEYTADYK